MYLCCTYWNFDVSCLLLEVRLSPRRLGRMSCSPHVSLAGFAYLEPLSRPIRVDDSSYNSPEHEQHRALELPSKLASLTERLAAQSNWVRGEEQKSPGRSPPSLTTSRIDSESEFARSGIWPSLSPPKPTVARKPDSTALQRRRPLTNTWHAVPSQTAKKPKKKF